MLIVVRSPMHISVFYEGMSMCELSEIPTAGKGGATPLLRPHPSGEKIHYLSIHPVMMCVATLHQRHYQHTLQEERYRMRP